MPALQPLVAAFLILATMPAAAAIPAPREAPPPGAAADGPGSGQAAGVSRRTPFVLFGSRPVLELRGPGSTATVDFGSRADELVTRATLHLRYSSSPSLDPAQSHIRILLNDDAVGVLPVEPGSAGRAVTRDVEIDPRLVVSFNKLAFVLVAQRAAGTEDAARPGTWADISGASELEVTARALPVRDDLALLPEPFFDRRDQRRVTIPFVFAAEPSLQALRAASVVASWLGRLAAWRGVRFPASLGVAAPGHAVVFAANGERPEFLSSLAPATGPQLRVMTNPADGRSKLLVVMGRDGNDLKSAADALALGGMAMGGPSVQVKEVREQARRPAYDVPNWVRMDRAMKLGELIDWPQQLQASGDPAAMNPVRVDLRMPPDLVLARGPGVPMTLRYRYAPPACAGESRLDVSVNDELVQVIALRTAARPGDAVPPGQPPPEAIVDSSEIFIPGFRLRGRNQLQFAFRFGAAAEGACRGARPAAVRAAIDADSTIDFSGFPHHAQMPQLAHFVSVGFPFTRHADLSGTVAVLPERPSAGDIEVLLTLLGRMGESTGYPSTGLRVVRAADEAALADADLIVIGAPPRQSLLDRWRDRLPAVVSGPARIVSAPARDAGAAYEWLSTGSAQDAAPVAQVSLESQDALAAILAFESPVTSGRSVVAVTAASPAQVVQVLDALEDPEKRRAVRGSAALVHPARVDAFLVGRTYSIGFLPPWTGLWYRLADYPLLLAAAGTLAFVFLAYLGWRLKHALFARRRRSGG